MSQKHSYFINGAPLKEVETHKDLGVWTTANLLPSEHCKKAVQKATSTLHWIRRAFKVFPPELFGKIFSAFVRPHLDYGMPVWTPWLKKDVDEQVQRRATKMVDGLRDLSYQERLLKLDLFPLSYRHLQCSLLWTFRIIRGTGSSLRLEDFFQLANTTHLRGHPYKVTNERTRLDLRKFFFSQRVVRPWNSLPSETVSADTIRDFKRRLDSLLFDKRRLLQHDFLMPAL